MTTPDFRALCAELLQAWQFGGDIAGPMNRARAALKAEPEGEGPSVEQMYYWALKSIYKYGSDTLSEQADDRGWLRAAVAEMVRRAQESLDYGTPVTPPAPEVGSRARELQELLAVLLDFLCLPGHAISEDDWRQMCLLSCRYCEPFLSRSPATPPAPEPGEVEEVAQWLHAHALDCRVLGRNDWAEQCTRAATLLQRLTSPAFLVVYRLPEGFSDLLKSEPGRIEACTAGVSIEPLRDAPHPTFQDAIKLAQGCHDYSGGHIGAEGEAWHGAIDTVVAVLKRAAIRPWDNQLKAVYGVGVEAQAGEVEA